MRNQPLLLRRRNPDPKRHNPRRAEPHLTTGTRADITTAPAIIGTAPPQSIQLNKSKTGSLTASRFPILLCRLKSHADVGRWFPGDSHRKSGVLQLWFSSKPGGVMLPPEPNELTPLIYSCVGGSASE